MDLSGKDGFGTEAIIDAGGSIAVFDESGYEGGYGFAVEISPAATVEIHDEWWIFGATRKKKIQEQAPWAESGVFKIAENFYRKRGRSRFHCRWYCIWWHTPDFRAGIWSGYSGWPDRFAFFWGLIFFPSSTKIDAVMPYAGTALFTGR